MPKGSKRATELRHNIFWEASASKILATQTILEILTVCFVMSLVPWSLVYYIQRLVSHRIEISKQKTSKIHE